MTRLLTFLVLVVVTQPVAAQPALAIGKPLPSADLPVGTIIVRVVDGTPTAPVAKVKVTLTVGKAAQTAITDDLGRARFDNLTVAAIAKASIATKDPVGKSESFAIPASGGTRILLSTKSWREAARKTSGLVVAMDSLPAGAVDVRVTYDNIADAKPPAGTVVSLVAYAADDTVKLQQTKTDAKGIAHFTKLDVAGTVAYFALAQLPRKAGIDRLMTVPFVLDTRSGYQITLSGEDRAAKTAAVDELVERQQQTATALPKAKVRVQLEGAVDPNTAIDVVDAGSGKVVAHGSAVDKELMLAVPARAGQILYVDATAKAVHYRSMPFEMVADRGAALAIYIYPRVLPTFEFISFADDGSLVVNAQLSLSNNSWSPYAESGRGPVVPLPRGATKIEIAPDDQALASVKAGSIEIARALPPGQFTIEVAFELPAKKGDVEWSLDLPIGMFKGSLYVEKETGLSIDRLPPSTKLDTKTTPRTTYFVVNDITILPKQSMAFVIHLAKPSADNALVHACRRLNPDATPLIGKPLEFTLTQLDGKRLALASLRGKPVLVNLMATWDMLSKEERPKLATLTKTVPGLAVVMVASDSDAKLVASTVGKLPFPVVLDPPATPNDNIGAVTTSWGVVALPESVLVDRKGIVRYHFQNSRAWDTPEALRCAKAFAK